MYFGEQFDDVTAVAGYILGDRGLVMLVVPGNHDNYDRIFDRDITPGVDADSRRAGGHCYAGSGSRWVDADSVRLAVRTPSTVTPLPPYLSWWEQEPVTQADIDTLGDELLEVLLTHDAPEGTR
ncbi:hypothetical protein OCAE111667_07245 [Occultella aeris]|uniref:Uncharacterized protein n=1 Tax=Occultella aeris TaxID=2761496 RepID=A0A7M4DRK0_9MICO|nr:hypothetical protein [Occultella aeris]VZO40094.1 hypothetical protein HALOF300_04795 [Occultella aeris]